MRTFSLVLSMCLVYPTLGQSIERIDPPFWWIGMENPKLELLLKGNGIHDYTLSSSQPGVVVESVQSLQSKNYLIVQLLIDADLAPGTIRFDCFRNGEKQESFNYDLRARTRPEPQSINGSDVIYLVMPDRFANGNAQNDEVKGMTEGLDRQAALGRHGGDLMGVTDHMAYFRELGITTLWLNPVYENNMPSESYHGYSITDHYRVDPRLGTMDDYRKFVQTAHEAGLKVIKDMIFNHIGLEHFWMMDLPHENWLNQWNEFTRTNYEGATVSDPYVSQHDYDQMVRGWFTPNMPDLNQQNDWVSRYLIQHSIWWIEHTGIDGIRMDTYPYPYRETMKEWVDAVQTEYPGFFLVGETWLHTPAHEGYWQGRTHFANKDGYDSGLPAVSDFPLHYALRDASRKGGSLKRIYDVLSQDFVYPDPYKLKIFLDNHDVSRFYHSVDGEFDSYQRGLVMLMTLRGIPQLLYGTELLMAGKQTQAESHGLIRADFPGGWSQDKQNAFLSSGREGPTARAFDFMQRLLQWRAAHGQLMAEGRLVHFIPDDNLYVYARVLNNRRAVVLINNQNKKVSVDFSGRYRELYVPGAYWRDFSSGERVVMEKPLSVPAYGFRLLYID